MKVKVTRPDGTVIEIEGTAQDVQAVASAFGFYPAINLFTQPAVAAGSMPVDFSRGGTFKVGY